MWGNTHTFGVRSVTAPRSAGPPHVPETGKKANALRQEQLTGSGWALTTQQRPSVTWCQAAAASRRLCLAQGTLPALGESGPGSQPCLGTGQARSGKDAALGCRVVILMGP